MVVRIVSTGSVIVDLGLRVPALPQAGGDVIASAPAHDAGGGFNLMYAAARQGAQVTYAGGLGTGPNGQLIATALQSVGVQILQAPIPSGDSGICVTLIDDLGERTFITAPGVEATTSATNWSAVVPAAHDIVTVSGYDLVYPDAGPTLIEWISALPPTQRIFLDPGPLVADIPADIWTVALQTIDILSLNDREAGLLGCDETEPVDVHRQLRELQALADQVLLIIRRGPDGCSVDGGPEGLPVTLVPSIAVDVVDTTGAGDTHGGVLLAELAAGTGTVEALTRANIAAALSVTRAGPATAPDRSAVDQWLDRRQRG